MGRAFPLLAWLGLASGCFSEPIPCREGTEGCACLELRCEEGLVCRQALCAAPSHDASTSDGMPSSGPNESGDPATTSSSGPSTTDTGPSTVAEESSSSATEAGTTPGTTADPDETSSSTDPSTGSASFCGDGILDPSEICDTTPGCTDDCTLTHYECNPLNNAPCPEGFKCSVSESEEGVAQATCRPFAQDPPGQLHEGNCYYLERRDHWCDVGLACALISATDACGDTNCCVEFCDLTDATFSCAYAGDACVPFLGSAAPTGLAHLGFCARP